MDEDILLSLGVMLDMDPGAVEAFIRPLLGKMEAGTKKVGEASGKAQAEGQAKGYRTASNAILQAQKSANKKSETEHEHHERRLTDISKAEQLRRNTIQRQGTTQGQVGVDKNRYGLKERLAEEQRIQDQMRSRTRAADAQAVADIKRRNALIIAAEQQAGVRRTAIIRTVLNNLTRANQTGMTLIVNAWRSHQAKVLEAQKSGNRREEAEFTASLSRREARLRASLTQQAAIQGRASASDRANQVASTGVLGAATGRSNASLLAGGFAGGMLVRRSFNVLADFQQIETAFKGIFREIEGGAPKTTAFLKEMQEFAKETPFSLREVSDAAQKLFTNRIVDSKAPDAIDQVKDKLRILADAASATGKSAEQMNMGLLGITQIGSSGQFMMEELRQITENIGLPMEEVAKALGMSVAEMREEMKAGAITATDGLNAVFEAMKNIPGAAGASARQAKTLRGSFAALNDVIDQFILRIGKGIGERVAALVNAFVSLASSLMDGTGAWKVARDAIGGIAKVLGAVLVVGGAAQVLKLVAIGLGAIAGSPLALAVTGIAALAGGLTALYKNNDKVKSFFDELVRGTRNWFEVGFLIKEPITEFSKFVLLQSSLGAAFRIVRDGFRGIQDAVMVLIRTRSLDAFMESLSITRESLRGRFDPIRDALVDGFGGAFEQALATVKQSRTNVGTFLAAIMTVTGVGGPISRMLARSISGIFGVAVKDADMDSPAADMALKVKDAWDRAFATARDIQTVVVDFFRSAFKGLDSGTAVAALGLSLRDAVIRAVEGIGDVSEKVASVIGNIGGAIGSKLTAALVPWVIELPRVVGRFLSETAFSEEFIKVFGGLALGLAATAAAIALQFARGFVEGLWNRRGDIAKVFQDIFAFIFSGSWLGDIGARLAQALIAGFVAAKAWGGLNAVAAPFRKFAIGMTNDLAGARTGLKDLAKDAEGTGSRAADLGQKFHRLGDLAHSGARKARDGIGTLGAKLEGAGAAMRGVSSVYVNQTGQMVKAGSSMSRATVVSVGRMRDALGRFTMATGQVVSQVSRDMQAVGSAATKAGRAVQAGWQKIGGAQGALSSAVALGASAISGYMVGMADDAESKSAAVVASLGSIAAAWVTGGPILGTVALGVALFGTILGTAAKKAKAEAARIREVEDAAKRMGEAYGAALEKFGRSDNGKLAASWDVINKTIGDTDGKLQLITETFDVTFKEVADAIAGGGAAVKSLYDEIANREWGALWTGNVEGIEAYSGELEGLAKMGSFAAEVSGLEGGVEELNRRLLDGSIGIAAWAALLKEAGVEAAEVDALVEQFKDNITDNIASKSGLDTFFKKLAPEIDTAIAKNELLLEVQDKFRAAQEQLLPPVERYMAAWDRVKERIEKAGAAFRSYLDSIFGRESTTDQAILALTDRALIASQGKREGESDLAAGARLRENERQAFYDVEKEIAKLARDANGDMGKLTESTNAFFQTLIDGATSDEQRQFYRDLRDSPALVEAMMFALKNTDPIKTITDLTDRWGEFITDAKNTPILARIEEAPGNTERTNAIMAAVVEMANSDPAIKAFIEEGPGYQTVFEEILADKGLIGEGVSVPVKLDDTLIGNFKDKLNGLIPGFSFGDNAAPAVTIRPTLADTAGPDLQRELDDIIANKPLKVKIKAEWEGSPGWRNQPQGIRGVAPGGRPAGAFGGTGRIATRAFGEDGMLGRDLAGAIEHAIVKATPGMFDNMGKAGAAIMEYHFGDRGMLGNLKVAFGRWLGETRPEVAGSIGGAIDSALYPRQLEVEVVPVIDRFKSVVNNLIPGFSVFGAKSNWRGGLETSPVLSTLAERGPEAIFPLTNPMRMRQIMGIPQVATAFERAGMSNPAPPANYAPVSVDQSQVNHFEIHEARHPRQTASEIIRSQRRKRHLGGHTLPVVIR